VEEVKITFHYSLIIIICKLTVDYAGMTCTCKRLLSGVSNRNRDEIRDLESRDPGDKKIFRDKIVYASRDRDVSVSSTSLVFTRDIGLVTELSLAFNYCSKNS
jgi:hypothetical protein